MLTTTTTTNNTTNNNSSSGPFPFANQLRTTHPSTLRRFALVTLVCLLLVALTAPTFGQEVKSPAVGTIAPTWSGLMGTDDQPHSSDELQDAKAVLVVFLCNHCPCAKSYEARFIEFAREFEDRNVRVVAFNSDTAEKLDAMQERAKANGYNFPYLKDEGQKVARAFGAKTTPHVFLLDGQRKVVFAGAFDNDKSGKTITKHHIRDAVQEVLEGKPVSVVESRLCGCGITYAPFTPAKP